MFRSIFLTFFVAASVANAGQLQGTALYRERIALPPGAVFEASLLDVSLADAPAKVLGVARIEPAGNPPYQFDIRYDDAAVVPGHRYSVQAKITLKGQLLFITDTHNAALNGAPPLPSLIMRSVRGADKAAAASPSTWPFGPVSSYSGLLPAADGPGVRWQLDLLEGGRYQLRETYLGRGKGKSFDSVGVAQYDPSKQRLQLVGESDDTYFVRVDDKTLRKLDIEGQPIQSSLNYSLKKLTKAKLLVPQLQAKGMLTYQADAAHLALCGSDLRLPIAMEEAYKALETQYLKTRREPGDAVMAEFAGRVVQRASVDGGKPMQTLIVQGPAKLHPRENCSAAQPIAKLTDTYWKLTRIGEKPVVVKDKQREPHLVLATKDQRLSGHGGCNRLMGSYKLDGEKLSFGQVASTRMACIDGMDTEHLFSTELGKVQSHKINGNALQMLDASGLVILQFEAVALR